MKTVLALVIIVGGYIAYEVLGKTPAKGTTAARLAKPYRRAMSRLAA